MPFYPRVDSGYALVRASSASGTSIPAAIPEPSWSSVVGGWSRIWWSMAHKLDRDMDTMNACLVPDIEQIETRLRSMSSIASALPGLPNFRQLVDPYYDFITYSEPKFTSNILTSIQCIVGQSEQTMAKVRISIETTTEWSLVPKVVHDQLHACADELLRQSLDLSIMAGVISICQITE